MYTFDTVLEWVATLCVIVSATLVAFHIEPINIYVLNVGAFLWLVWAIRVKKKSLIILNGYNLIIYFAGLLYQTF